MTRAPRAMSTQHPDNVNVPFFASGPVMNGEDEIREAYYAFSHLGCDEQMWDFEGKEVDEFVVEKLLSQYESYFREHPLGESVFLTPRVPNPALERAQAKILLEVLHSIPRHSDVARLFYGRERPPITELIFPMATSAAELARVRDYYRARVGALEQDPALRSWFGAFRPRDIAVIPLVEDRPSLLDADAIVEEFLLGSDAERQRVFIARSDPALNYGMTAAILLSLVALARLDRLEQRRGIAIEPILGAGGAPFRGSLRPDSLDRVLARYPSVATFTIQSAFKYDHPADAAARAIATLRETPRRPALELDEERAAAVSERAAAGYATAVTEVAPLVRALAAHVPRRRMRKLHIGLFGYSRSAGGNALPRAIPFCASLYAIGLPPEILGLSALGDDDLAWLRSSVPCIESDLRDALTYLDPEVAELVPALGAEIARAERLREAPPQPEHRALAREVRARLAGGETQTLGELITREGAIRRFLG